MESKCNLFTTAVCISERKGEMVNRWAAGANIFEEIQS
jgi:hypothetical protein